MCVFEAISPYLWSYLGIAFALGFNFGFQRLLRHELLFPTNSSSQHTSTAVKEDVFSNAVTEEDRNPVESTKQRTNANDTRSPMAKAFSNLELFVSTFPGKPMPIREDEDVNGFTELKETFIRTLQFFWPRESLKLTAILDESTYSNDEERDGLVANFTSLFADDVPVNLKLNPRTNVTLYGTGWYIQQLVMLWADNFTNAEYIGFVDDDTVISSAVHPYDLFDEEGRPRVIAKAAEEGVKAWAESSTFAFKRTSKVYAMTYFPVIVKREHLAMMRNEIMAKHPEYSTFDDFYTALIHRGVNKTELTELSQFCIIMDYLYESHREEYSWHFETTKRIANSSAEMYEPFPRIAIHGSYLFVAVNRLRAARKLAGRRKEISEIMREGYCYSLPSWNNTEINARRCGKYNVDAGIHARGEWKFEQYASPWLVNANATLAHAQRREHRDADHVWDDEEVKKIFGL